MSMLNDAETDLTPYLKDEVAFSERLGRFLGAGWSDVEEERHLNERLSKLIVEALLTSVRTTEGRQVTPKRLAELTSARLYFAIGLRGRNAPDIVLIDANDRVVVVIECKGPDTETQWTPMGNLRGIPWASGALSEKVKRRVEETPVELDAPHSDHVDCACTMGTRAKLSKQKAAEVAAALAAGSTDPAHTGPWHQESVHQGDAYRYGRHWLPAEFTMAEDCVWLALLPSQYSVATWREELVSYQDWSLVRVRTFHQKLKSQRDDPTVLRVLTARENHRLRTLVEGMSELFGLDTETQTGDEQWGKPWSP